MANSKEINARIKSVQNTRKITCAMEMISTTKLKKARQRMERSKPYANLARQMIHHVAHANTDYEHPYLKSREVKSVGIIVVSTDKALCGGLNVNLFKSVLKAVQEWQEKGVTVKLGLIGSKAEPFFKRLGVDIVSYVHHLGDVPESSDLIGSVKLILDAYAEGSIDKVDIFANEFENTITQKPYHKQLVPAEAGEDLSDTQYQWDYLYEPAPGPILDTLLKRYIESQVYQSVVENIACEHAARMIAMKNASDNASDVIKDLKLQYNKARQAAITCELAEIVSGADAIEED